MIFPHGLMKPCEVLRLSLFLCRKKKESLGASLGGGTMTSGGRLELQQLFHNLTEALAQNIMYAVKLI